MKHNRITTEKLLFHFYSKNIPSTMRLGRDFALEDKSEANFHFVSEKYLFFEAKNFNSDIFTVAA